ncbi:voltage-gated potassium channel [Meredithblackwellia eburnea MCA 4105]
MKEEEQQTRSSEDGEEEEKKAEQVEEEEAEAAHRHGRFGIQNRSESDVGEGEDRSATSISPHSQAASIHSTTPANRGTSSQPKGSWWEDAKAHIDDSAKFAPLLCAVLAPLATLLDIPALTQKWYTLDGKSAPDPGASLVLSAVGLAMNVCANALLVARFTVRESWWRKVTTASVICWCVKLVVAIVNLSVYGALTRNSPGYSYDEGFWCAVVSCIISGMIVFLLVAHYILRFDRPSSSGALIRVAGAQFILTVMWFISVIGVEGLIFSKVEGWTFLQGIYFAVVTAFTIGFGDFEPTYTVTRVLLFPFAVFSIALLAAQIGVLVDFLNTAAENRRSRWRVRYERKVKEGDTLAHSRHPEVRPGRMKEVEEGERKHLALAEEIAALQKMEKLWERHEMVFALTTSSLSLLVFWLIGGAAFMAIEGFAFGSSMYFCYVFFLTIGYGDYSPSTPGGRVFFIVYALMAVPVVTNFVLNSFTSILHSITADRFQRARDEHAPTKAEKRMFHSHAWNVESSGRRLWERFGDNSDDGNSDQASGEASMVKNSRHGDVIRSERAGDQRQHDEVAKVVLGLALRLEAQATTLLLETLPRASKEQLLLRGDRNLMLRALRELKEEDETKKTEENGKHGNDKGRKKRRRSSDAEIMHLGTMALEEEMREEIEEAEDVARTFLDPTTGETDTLEEIRRYRETVGGLLAAGSLLMKLEGKERGRFERRLDGEHEADHGGMLLGSGRKGPAEKALDIDV